MYSPPSPTTCPCPSFVLGGGVRWLQNVLCASLGSRDSYSRRADGKLNRFAHLYSLCLLYGLLSRPHSSSFVLCLLLFRLVLILLLLFLLFFRFVSHSRTSSFALFVLIISFSFFSFSFLSSCISFTPLHSLMFPSYSFVYKLIHTDFLLIIAYPSHSHIQSLLFTSCPSAYDSPPVLLLMSFTHSFTCVISGSAWLRLCFGLLIVLLSSSSTHAATVYPNRPESFSTFTRLLTRFVQNLPSLTRALSASNPAFAAASSRQSKNLKQGECLARKGFKL